MHGFALTSMLNTTAREFISKRSEQKSVGMVPDEVPKNLWNQYEGLSLMERLQVGIYKKFLKVEDEDKVNIVIKKYLKDINEDGRSAGTALSARSMGADL
jgi:hypothetical protein